MPAVADPLYDCQTCGACCASPWTGEGYALLYPNDVARLDGLGLPVFQMTQGDGDDAITLLGTRVDGQARRVCVAFGGEVGGACACTVYEARPAVCRDVEPGDGACRDSRRRFGLPILEAPIRSTGRTGSRRRP